MGLLEGRMGVLLLGQLCECSEVIHVVIHMSVARNVCACVHCVNEHPI